jgi:hypothetical protein
MLTRRKSSANRSQVFTTDCAYSSPGRLSLRPRYAFLPVPPSRPFSKPRSDKRFPKAAWLIGCSKPCFFSPVVERVIEFSRARFCVFLFNATLGDEVTDKVHVRFPRIPSLFDAIGAAQPFVVPPNSSGDDPTGYCFDFMQEFVGEFGVFRRHLAVA